MLLIVLAVALAAVIGYAAYADWSARRDGQILVPVKEGRGRRTKFVRMDRAEAEAQRAEAILAKQQREKAERAMDDGITTPGRALSKSIRRALARR